MLRIKVTYINPFKERHTLTGTGGTLEGWTKWLYKNFGRKNIIKIEPKKYYD